MKANLEGRLYKRRIEKIIKDEKEESKQRKKATSKRNS